MRLWRRFLSPLLNSLSGASRKLFILMVYGYQLTLSHFMGGNCRFYPSCSCYAIETLKAEHLRLDRALWLIGKRLLSCHPFGKHGYDPAPRGRKNVY